MVGPSLPPRVIRAELIRARLRLAGWTARELSVQHDLPIGAVDHALKIAHAPGERAIAKALNTRPEFLWPERYDVATGERLTPQPRENNDPVMPVSQRRALRVRVSGAGA